MSHPCVVFCKVCSFFFSVACLFVCLFVCLFFKTLAILSLFCIFCWFNLFPFKKTTQTQTHTHIGPCDSHCDPSKGIDCPRTIRTGAPTLDPTAPTSNPTQVPSINPTESPTDSPSIAPSLSPTNTPTDIPSSTPTTSPVEPNVNLNSKISQLESIGSYLVIFGICIGLGITITGRWYSHIKIKGSDGSSDNSILKFFASAVDMWTDILFMVILYFEENRELFYGSLGSLGISYLMQCCVGIYKIETWRKGTRTPHLKEYVNRYETLLIFLTVVVGFYPCVILLNSKLFYLSMFNFELTKNEKNHLRSLQFVNIVIFENIPQLLIQLIYITSVALNETSIIVFISMIFTILSLVFSIMREISVCCQFKSEKSTINKHDIYCFFSIEMSLKCDSFEWQHAFAHNKIESCIQNVIKNCDILKQGVRG